MGSIPQIETIRYEKKNLLVMKNSRTQETCMAKCCFLSFNSFYLQPTY